MANLYQNWDGISEEVKSFIQNVFKLGDYNKIFQQVQEQEQLSKNMLVQFQQKQSYTVTESNVDSILDMLINKKDDKNT